MRLVHHLIVLIAFLLPLLLLLLLLIVIYDGVGTYNEISIYDQLSDSVDCSI